MKSFTRKKSPVSPGVRILCRPYGTAGISRKRETAFFHGLYLYYQSLFIAVFPENANPRKLWFRALHEMRAMPYGPQTIF